MLEAILKCTVLSAARGVLSIDSIKSVPDFASFLKLLKALFRARSRYHFSLIFGPIITQMPQYIGKPTTCTLCHAQTQM